MNIEDTRYAFRISSKMLDIKKNFSQKYRRKNVSLTCDLCKVRESDDPRLHLDVQERPEESQFHLANECIAFNDLRSMTDFSDDQETVSFFKAVMEKRSNFGNKMKQAHPRL